MRPWSSTDQRPEESPETRQLAGMRPEPGRGVCWATALGTVGPGVAAEGALVEAVVAWLAVAAGTGMLVLKTGSGTSTPTVAARGGADVAAAPGAAAPAAEPEVGVVAGAGLSVPAAPAAGAAGPARASASRREGPTRRGSCPNRPGAACPPAAS